MLSVSTIASIPAKLIVDGKEIDVIIESVDHTMDKINAADGYIINSITEYHCKVYSSEQHKFSEG